MFSRRLNWVTGENNISRLIKAKRAAGCDILDLTESNPTRAGFDYPPALVEALANVESLRYEPAPFGIASARRHVAAALGCDAQRLVLTASTSEAYSYLFKLLADPGDEILVPQPSYPLFEYLAKLDSVRIREYPLRYHEGWWIDRQALATAVSSRARALVVVNPNNPTGSYLKPEELDALATLCATHNLALISDEVFFPFQLDASVEPATAARTARCLTFTLGGLSKLLGLPQMKLGWIQISGPATLVSDALAALEMIADSYLSVSAPVQHAAGRWLSWRQNFHAMVIERLRNNLAALGAVCQPLHVEGGWNAVVPLSTHRSEEEWITCFLEEMDVLVQPGFFYDFAAEPYIVVSLLTPPGVFQEGLRRLSRAQGGGVFRRV
jgi:aspartate/methionine/tyrosine aminotransferase